MIEERKFHYSQFLFPALFVLVLWVIHLLKAYTNFDFVQFGLYPRRVENLFGIITSPFIHDDWEHLTNNSIPLLLLGFGIFYFYREVAFKIYLGSILITGLWVWVFARPSYHIGASGMVYSFASFVFFSGFIRRYYRLIALSLLVVFVYGSLIWGILPIDYRISWESHLMGGLCGLLLAYFYREFGPAPKQYEWEEDEEDDSEPFLPEEFEETDDKIEIIYTLKKKENN